MPSIPTRRQRGPAPVTSRDIADQAGVSQSTVSRALRGDPRVAEATRGRVIEAARRLQYTPNIVARSLITNRTRTIGVVVADITNPFYPQLLDVLHDEFSLAGYRTVLFNERTDLARGQETMLQLLGRSIDGVAFTSATLGSRWAAAVAERGLPVVLLNRYVDEVAVDRVVSDNHRGGELVARFLAELGHRRIAVIAGPDNTSTSRDREQGFDEAMRELGIPVGAELRRSGGYSHQSGYQWCRDLLAHEPRPTAIFCGNDVVAFGALDAARSMGVAVPEDLSIIGFDDIEMASWEVFRLSTVSQQLAQMAKSAARMLVERLESLEPLQPRTVGFPTRLVRRETTGPAPEPDRWAAT